MVIVIRDLILYYVLFLSLGTKLTVGNIKEEFPKITNLLASSSELIYVRSQIQVEKSVSSPKVFVPSEFYLADEWLIFDNTGAAEYRATVKDQVDLKNEFSYLAYETFGELFKLTHDCKGFHSEASNNARPSREWILRQLIQIAAIGGRAGNLAYLPLALWLFVSSPDQLDGEEDRSHNLTLSSSNQSSNVWLVEVKELELAFEMQFKITHDVGRHSHSLEVVKLNSLSDKKDTFKIIISIVNSRYISRHSQRFDQSVFRIPQGLGCTRSRKAKNYYKKSDTQDVIVFERISPIEFNYEASLALMKEDVLEPAKLIVSGWFGRCPANWNLMRISGLQVDLQNRHYLDGRIDVLRRISDDSHAREIDELTGECSIMRLIKNQHEADEVLRLNFGNSAGDIILTSKYLSTNNQDRIQTVDQTWLDGQWRKIVYETRLDQIVLSETLKGPGSIVKTFRRKLSNDEGKKLMSAFYYHTDFQLEIIIYDKAHLTVRLSKLKFRECLEIVREAHLYDCLADHRSDVSSKRARQFELDFAIENENGQQLDLASVENVLENNKVAFERKLLDVIVSQAVSIPPTRIAHIPQIAMRHTNIADDKSQVFANLEIIEPTEVMYLYNLALGKRLQQASELNGLVRLTSSTFKCSNLCETMEPNGCFAFTYCSDRTCHLIKRPTEITTTNSLEYLKPRLRDDPRCSLYYSPSLQTEDTINSVDSLVSLIKKQIDESKRSIRLTSLTDTRLQLVLNRISDRGNWATLVTASNSFDHGEQKSEDYVTIEAGARLDFTKWVKQENNFDKGLPIFKVEHVRSEGHCLELCQNAQCLIGSYCFKSRVCSLVSNLSLWQYFSKLVNQAERNSTDCSIFSKNFLQEYERFKLTSEPKNYHAKMIDFSQQNCATKCSMRDAIEDGDYFKDCLSFDYCYDSLDRPICYLNQMHLIMDDFDETILDSGLGNGSKIQTTCQHFSRNILSDFELLAENKRFSKYHSIVFNSIELEKCGLICKRGETCLAFEYCAIKSSCYISRINLQSEGNSTQFAEASIEDQCKIYKLKHIEEHSELLDELLEHKLNFLAAASREQSSKSEVNESQLYSFGHFVCLSLVALTLGTSLSLIATRVFMRR